MGRHPLTIRTLGTVLAVSITVTASVASADEDAGDSATARSSNEQARRYFQEGSEAYDNGQFERAIELFERAYELAGIEERVILLVNLGMAHDRLEHRERAIELFERYLSLAPDGPKADFVRSRLKVLRSQAAPGSQAASGEAGGDAGRPTPSASATAPEAEASAEGRSVLNEAPEPKGKEGGIPWWPFAVGGAVVVTGAVVAVLLLGGGESYPPGVEPLDLTVEALR